MRERLALCIALAATAALPAQTVFPRGYDKLEGSRSQQHLGHAESNFQQIYYGRLGVPIAGIRKLRMRRDAFLPGGAPRTLTCELRVGHGKTSGWSRTYASNYAGVPTTVFKGTMRLPDKTKVPFAGPQPFDLGIPFNQPFHYSGKAAFAWQLIVTKSSLLSAYSSYPSDRADTGGDVVGSINRIGTGCKTNTSGTSTFSLLGNVGARASGMRLGFMVAGAPRNAPVTAHVGLRNVNLSGLFCATIHTDGLIVVPLGVASATGTMPLKILNAGPWRPAYRGVKAYAQLAAIQAAPGPEVKLSQALEIALPPAATPPVVRAVYLYGTGKGSATRTVSDGPVDTGSGVVVEVSS